MNAMNPLDGSALLFGSTQMIPDEDAPDNQYVSVQLYFPGNVSRKLSIARINFARFQRASERPGQSATGRCNDVIQRRGPRGKFVRWNLIVLGYFRVNAERHRLVFARQIGKTNRPLFSFNSDS